jgi:hypothetical protein
MASHTICRGVVDIQGTDDIKWPSQALQENESVQAVHLAPDAGGDARALAVPLGRRAAAVRGSNTSRFTRPVTLWLGAPLIKKLPGRPS